MSEKKSGENGKARHPHSFESVRVCCRGLHLPLHLPSHQQQQQQRRDGRTHGKDIHPFPRRGHNTHAKRVEEAGGDGGDTRRRPPNTVHHPQWPTTFAVSLMMLLSRILLVPSPPPPPPAVPTRRRCRHLVAWSPHRWHSVHGRHHLHVPSPSAQFNGSFASPSPAAPSLLPSPRSPSAAYLTTFNSVHWPLLLSLLPPFRWTLAIVRLLGRITSLPPCSFLR